MCPPGYHHNGFVAHHVLKCMSCHKAIVVITETAFMITYIYIYIYKNIIYIYIYIYVYI